MVDVPTKDEYDALVARVAALEAHVHELPQNVKDALAIVAAWIQTV